ncbi:NUMOD4 domain-containing protein [Priestia megaterium]|uniref:NUMOD4 domain-containing protein n=1 Tax=Priestia megaterium TaxID=1404 RepID=UPI000BA6D3F6|nr:NUMOD4 domain-containing protein [Priestia megaterium]PAK47600.1 hypothetical protein CHH47_19330 [Priestia megaterium]
MAIYQNLDLRDIPGEQWKQFHEGKRNRLFVSNFGRIKSVEKKNGKELIRKQRVKKQFRKVNGIYHERLYIRIDRENIKAVSRLVAQEFILNPNNYPCVLHNDDNPKNNHVSNLRWGTYAENNEQTRNGGSTNFKKHIVLLTRDGEKIQQFNSMIGARLYLNSKDTTGFEKAKAIRNYVVMKKEYYDELNHEQLKNICKNVNSRGIK